MQNVEGSVGVAADMRECPFLRKVWSEAHVSEDFDMSVRLQIRGYIGRYIAYTGTGAAYIPNKTVTQ
jgi:hypothetical protein